MARECRVLPKEYRLYRTVVPFGWCLCALFIELLFTSPEAYHCRGDTPYFRMAHITIFGIPGWVPTEMTQSGPICGQRATSVATRVIKCGCGKIGEQQYALVPGGLASWTGMVS